MEDITPTLILLWDVKRAIERGQSIRVGVQNFIERTQKNQFKEQVKLWWLSQTGAQVVFDSSQMSVARKHLLEILEHGLRGLSILETLKSYEQELIFRCEDEIQKHIARLPMILMIPLMGLIFPAMILLLLGPLLKTIQF